jgi:hypothetical protein
MEIKRTMEILVETRRRFIFISPDDAARFCPVCGELMLTAEQAARFFQINCRDVYRLIETEAAHFVETETGAVMICLAWLENALQRGAKEIGAETAEEI